MASSLAHLRWRGRNVVLWVFRRDLGVARFVIERDLIEDEGEEESTRSAARRRQSLKYTVSRFGSPIVGGAYIVCRIGEIERGQGWLA